MDNIKVNLLNITGLEAAYLAVQKPYGKKVKNPSELFYKVAKILKHESIMEHIIFQFEIDGSSRLELQEHMRHRMASSTVTSTRFTAKKMYEDIKKCYSWNFEDKASLIKKYTVIPDDLYSGCFINRKMYKKIINQRFIQLKFWAKMYERYGVDVAKYELIESLRTSFIWTINLRSMLNFLELRRALNAHFEIRSIANLMYNLLCENEEIKRLLDV